MEEKEVNKKGKRKFFKRVKVIVCLFASILVIAITVLVCILISRFKDTNRSNYQSRGISSSEIISKNYIDGFSNISTTGKFSFIVPEEDINELLGVGVKSLNDKYIKDIYFDIDELGYQNFYVDLVKVGVKTRVVISTVPSILDETTIKLDIYSVSMGKVNTLDMLKKKGYISKQFIDPFFKASSLPIVFDEDSLSFLISPYSFIKKFPNTYMGEYIFNTLKNISNAYSFNSNIFGFDADISKLSSHKEYVEVNKVDTLDVYFSVKEGCISNYDSMLEGETRSIYSLTEEVFNKHIKSSFVSNKKEEVSSSYTTNKVIFDLLGANIHLDQSDKINVTLFLLINNYIISIDTYLSYISSSSSIFFGGYFELQSNLDPFINESLKDVISSLSDRYSYFEYTPNEMLRITLESLDSDPDIPLDIRHSQKAIEINPLSKSIEFKLTK